MRQYGREDVDYETWYGQWSKDLARNRTLAELKAMLHGKSAEAKRGASSHERAIRRSTSMQSQSAARAHAKNVTVAAGDAAIAIRGAIEIYELFPEHTKEGLSSYANNDV